MKHLFFIITFLVGWLTLVGQTHKYLGMHGLLDDGGIIFLEYRGYNITIAEIDGSLENEKSLNKIAAKNQQKNILASYSEKAFNIPNVVIESTDIFSEKPNSTINSACYLFASEQKKLHQILFQTLNQRDILLEHQIVESYFANQLSEYIDVDNNVSDIDFLGRRLALGNTCKWKLPNSVACGGAQISWSEFPSYQEAIVDLQARVLANIHPDVEILSDTDVDMLFEGVPTVARRIVYMPPLQNYPLGVYYIAQEVRGRYISCVLSNYVYNRYDYELLPLLQQVMQYTTIPDDARNEFDKPELEEPHTLKNYWSRYNIYGSSIRVGTWLPLGNAANLYSFAPSVNLNLGIPVKRDMAVDLTILFAFPTSREYFDYYVDRYSMMTAKTDLLVSVGGRYRYQKEMARNVYFTPYVGLGFHQLTTNKVKKYAKNREDNDEYYAINTMYFNGGVDFRFKRIGAFLEYNYTPYHWSRHAHKELGNSAVNLGLYFVLW